MTVWLEGISISAECPNDVMTDQVVTMHGTADYDLFNDGSDDVLVDVLAWIEDTDGNKIDDSETNRVIAAGSRQHFSHRVALSASYASPGHVGVTMRVSVSGADGGQQSADCGFLVSQ